MKLLYAIIQPHRLEPVRQALARIGVERMTVCDAQGFGRQRGHTEMYRGHEYQIALVRKIMLEIAVNDDFIARTIDAIRSQALTGPDGNIGDGKIFVMPLEETFDIASGSRGKPAIN